MQELNFLEVTIQDIKFKIKTIHAMYTAELAKVIKSDKSDVDLHNMCRDCFGSKKHSHP